MIEQPFLYFNYVDERVEAIATSALERLLKVSLANFLSFSPSLVSDAWSGEADRSELQSSMKSKLCKVCKADSGITLTTR